MRWDTCDQNLQTKSHPTTRITNHLSTRTTTTTFFILLTLWCVSRCEELGQLRTVGENREDTMSVISVIRNVLCCEVRWVSAGYLHPHRCPLTEAAAAATVCTLCVSLHECQARARLAEWRRIGNTRISKVLQMWHGCLTCSTSVTYVTYLEGGDEERESECKRLIGWTPMHNFHQF